MPSAITEWTDRVAVITGAAAGIGRACAFALAERGAHLVLADRDEQRLERTRSKLLDTYHKRRIISLVIDVTDDADVEMLAAETLERFGHADLLLNGANVAVGGRWEHVPTTEWLRCVDVNLLGVTRLLHHFLPALMRQRSGWVVNTVSSYGLMAENPNAGPLAATGAAVIGLSKSLAVYLAPHDVGVSILSPELTDAEFLTKAAVWTGPGSRQYSDDTPVAVDRFDEVARQLLAGLAEGTFLISCTPRTKERLVAWAADPETEIARLSAGKPFPDRSIA